MYILFALLISAMTYYTLACPSPVIGLAVLDIRHP